MMVCAAVNRRVSPLLTFTSQKSENLKIRQQIYLLEVQGRLIYSAPFEIRQPAQLSTFIHPKIFFVSTFQAKRD